MVDLSESTLSITVLGFFLDGRLKVCQGANVFNEKKSRAVMAWTFK